MAIQFACPGCSQPIEVDDQYAGQAATCPYCRRVVTVPRETTLSIQALPSARPLTPGDAGSAAGEGVWAGPAPTGLPPVPPPVGYAPVPPDPRQRTARTYGNYALICAGIVVALFAVTQIFGAPIVRDVIGDNPQSQPSFQELAQRMQRAPGAASVTAGACGFVFFALVGTALGVASLAQSVRGNWRGWVALLICAGILLLTCASTLLVGSTS